MSCTIGTYSAQNPSTTYTRAIKPIGASRRALDGTLISFYASLKWTWSVRWSGVTEAVKDLLMAELDGIAHLAWTPPEGTAYTVRVNSASWTPTPSGESCYDVSAELEQV
jgi:hypothetical protein